LDEIQAAIARDRDTVLKLSCNVESTFRFQNPGESYDSDEGRSFNLRRDLSILQRLGLLPGAELPACDLIRLLISPQHGITSCEDICGFKKHSSATWRGCALAKSGNYERGVKLALRELIATRSDTELAACKAQSAKELYKKDFLQIRPHHLLCMSCFVGKKQAHEYEPIIEDNLYEAIEACRQNPDIMIELVAGPCMICPPCPGYYPDSGLCALGFGIGLRDQKKDLDTLQLIDLDYGARLPAAELFRLIYERIGSTYEICAYKSGKENGPGWYICNGTTNRAQNYADAAASNLGLP
jgi:hypothetical protein